MNTPPHRRRVATLPGEIFGAFSLTVANGSVLSLLYFLIDILLNFPVKISHNCELFNTTMMTVSLTSECDISKTLIQAQSPTDLSSL